MEKGSGKRRNKPKEPRATAIQAIPLTAKEGVRILADARLGQYRGGPFKHIDAINCLLGRAIVIASLTAEATESPSELNEDELGHAMDALREDLEVAKTLFAQMNEGRGSTGQRNARPGLSIALDQPKGATLPRPSPFAVFVFFFLRQP